MGMIDCPSCGDPVAEDATACPHCGRALEQLRVPRWFQIVVAAISVGVAYWLYELLSSERLSILGAAAGLALYAGAIWIVMKALFMNDSR